MSLLTRFLTLREGSIVVVTIVTAVIADIDGVPVFTGTFGKSLLPYFAFLAIMAAGEVFVMTLGEIDLSIGACYLFAPFAFWKFTTAGLPLVPAVILALVVMLAVGAINGFFTAYTRLPSFVATLAMLFALDGITLIVSHSEQINTPGTSIIGQSTFANVLGAGTYSETLWAIGIVLVLQIVLSFSRWGIYTVAAGGNRLGSAESGINVRLVLIRNFMLSALFGGFAGILEAIRSGSISPDPTGSSQWLLYAIAAVIIGGTVMTGGEGTVVGAFIGALFLGVLQDALVFKSVSANYSYLYIGIAVIIAMLVNVLIQRVRRGAGHG